MPIKESRAYPGWSTPQGTAETRVNLSTGETLSRAQFSKTIGELFRTGFNSFEGRINTLRNPHTSSPKSGGIVTSYASKNIVDADKAAAYILSKTSHKATAQFNFNVKISKDISESLKDTKGKHKKSDARWRSLTSGYASDIQRHLDAFLAEYEIEEDDIEEWEFNAYEE